MCTYNVDKINTRTHLKFHPITKIASLAEVFNVLAKSRNHWNKSDRLVEPIEIFKVFQGGQLTKWRNPGSKALIKSISLRCAIQILHMHSMKMIIIIRSLNVS